MGRPAKDLTGMKFNNLTAISIYERCGHHKPVKWLCKCDCGNTYIVDSQTLQSGMIKDCGCGYRLNLVGKRFGRLTVVRPATWKNIKKNRVWECRCDCGNISYVTTSNLTKSYKPTSSCGCLTTEAMTKHGLSNTKLYKILVSIKGRCKNKNNKYYSSYGGRGITLCDEWDGPDGFKNFYDWSMENGYKEGLTIDRIDNSKGYSPDNCRWTTQKVQMNNRRRNHYITVNGVTHTLTEWSEISGIPCGTICDRIKRGWSDTDAVTKATRHK